MVVRMGGGKGGSFGEGLFSLDGRKHSGMAFCGHGFNDCLSVISVLTIIYMILCIIDLLAFIPLHYSYEVRDNNICIDIAPTP